MPIINIDESGGESDVVAVRSHIGDLHLLEDIIFSDLDDVLSFDTLNGLTLTVKSINAEEAPVLGADPITDLGEAAMIVRAGCGFKNVGRQSLDAIGTNRDSIVPIHEIDDQILVRDVGIENVMGPLSATHGGPRCAGGSALFYSKDSGIEDYADL